MPPASPLPTPATSVRAAASPAPAATGASVKVFDEIEYVCQPGDTFESISKKYYQGAPQFAEALKLHNKNHARASDNMQSTATLRPGEKVFIPQAYILEERYAGVIKKSDTPASPTMPATFTTPSAPPPSGSSAGAPLIPVPAAPTPPGTAPLPRQ